MKKIVVLGGGISGYGSAILARKKGFDVFLSDAGRLADDFRARLLEHGVPFEEGGHTVERILTADEVIKSPGIPDGAPLVRRLREKGIPVISEIEFAGRYMGGAKAVCITGSNGKTTTTSLIYKILRDAGYNVALGGNIGESFAWSVATGAFDWYVLELSSFQLDGMHDFRAHVAVLMNITPDHLDRYDYDFQQYIDSKMRIVQNQTGDDCFIYWADDPVIAAQLPRYKLRGCLDFATEGISDSGRGIFSRAEGGVGSPTASEAGGKSTESEAERPRMANSKQPLRMRRLPFSAAQVTEIGLEVEKLQIKGLHNLLNAEAAMLAGRAAGVPDESILRSIYDFRGVEHRLEPAGEIDGVQYINDSKATNVDSAWYALESQQRPVVWIAGGTDKGNDYAPLMDFARGKVHTLVCMGVDNDKLVRSFTGVVPHIVSTGSLDEAMRAARRAARPGDVVLLSPACASFDLFKNYEHRGRMFKEWIKENGGSRMENGELEAV